MECARRLVCMPFVGTALKWLVDNKVIKPEQRGGDASSRVIGTGGVKDSERKPDAGEPLKNCVQVRIVWCSPTLLLR